MAQFQIGLSMAGAISAGAYTAGVVDFLCEALSEWEKARGEPDIPRHRAVIAVMSGASAGGIITALAPVALADGIEPVTRAMAPAPPGTGVSNPNLCVLPALYRAWVERPTLFEDPNGGLLGLRDLGADEAPVRSLLDTTLLDEICAEALKPRAGGRAGPHPWIAEKLHLFLTVSNLHGVPYGIAFSGTDAQGLPKTTWHVIQLHGDRVHFELGGVGSVALSSPWAEADPAHRLDIADLYQGGTLPMPWAAYGITALATSAFPIGLSARHLAAKSDDYAHRQWPIERPKQPDIEPLWPQRPVADIYDFSSVDGGMINNEPFEFAHWTLLEDPTASGHNPREGDRADRAVLMIDPFPDPPAFDFAEAQDTALVWVVKKLLPALQQQARFKLEELVAAAEEARYSRFMVEPQRSDANGPVGPGLAIAGGLLGGFGGFLDRRLRAHDYQLGRRNCQWFLRHSFALPPTNPIIAADWTEAAKARFQTKDADGTLYHPIIPLMGTADLPVPAPDWPRLEPEVLDILIRNVRLRADGVVDWLIQGSIGNRLLRQLARGTWCCWGRSKLLASVRKAVEGDLKRRGHVA